MANALVFAIDLTCSVFVQILFLFKKVDVIKSWTFPLSAPAFPRGDFSPEIGVGPFCSCFYGLGAYGGTREHYKVLCIFKTFINMIVLSVFVPRFAIAPILTILLLGGLDAFMINAAWALSWYVLLGARRGFSCGPMAGRGAAGSAPAGLHFTACRQVLSKWFHCYTSPCSSLKYLFPTSSLMFAVVKLFCFVSQFSNILNILNSCLE